MSVRERSCCTTRCSRTPIAAHRSSSRRSSGCSAGCGYQSSVCCTSSPTPGSGRPARAGMGADAARGPRGPPGACSALIVTTDWRARWIGSRRLLPHRPVLVAPVFSNLPSSAPGVSPDGTEPVVGLFGYSYQGAAISLVLDAISGLRGNGRQVRLGCWAHPARIPRRAGPGSPGRQSAPCRMHCRSPGGFGAGSIGRDRPLRRAAFRRCGRALAAQGTLAGSLASGRPVIAIDGRHTWRALVSAGAARVVAPEADALAGAIDSLLGGSRGSGRVGRAR